MEKRKTTGELPDILKNKCTCAEIQEEISSEQITESLADCLNKLVAEREVYIEAEKAFSKTNGILETDYYLSMCEDKQIIY